MTEIVYSEIDRNVTPNFNLAHAKMRGSAALHKTIEAHKAQTGLSIRSSGQKNVENETLSLSYVNNYCFKNVE